MRHRFDAGVLIREYLGGEARCRPDELARRAIHRRATTQLASSRMRLIPSPEVTNVAPLQMLRKTTNLAAGSRAVLLIVSLHSDPNTQGTADTVRTSSAHVFAFRSERQKRTIRSNAHPRRVRRLKRRRHG